MLKHALFGRWIVVTQFQNWHSSPLLSPAFVPIRSNQTRKRKAAAITKTNINQREGRGKGKKEERKKRSLYQSQPPAHTVNYAKPKSPKTLTPNIKKPLPPTSRIFVPCLQARPLPKHLTQTLKKKIHSAKCSKETTNPTKRSSNLSLYPHSLSLSTVISVALNCDFPPLLSLLSLHFLSLNI